jgi:DNA-binding response OmpR family regulator
MKTKQIKIDEARFLVSVGGKNADLTRKEYDILLALYKADGIVLTRLALLSMVWGLKGSTLDSRIVDQTVARLRKKIGPVIGTVPTRGYSYIGL